MTIDIEKLIADIDEDGSGEIEYDEFRNLLSSSDWLRQFKLCIIYSEQHFYDKSMIQFFHFLKLKIYILFS